MTTRHHVAREFHAALTAGDWNRMRAIMTPEITWTLPGDNAVSGCAEGVEAVLDRVQLIASYGLTFMLEHVLVSRDHMALALHNTAHRTTRCSTNTSPPSAGWRTAGSSKSRPSCPTSPA